MDESLSGLGRFSLARTGHGPAVAGPSRYGVCNGRYFTVIKRRAPGRSACTKQPLAAASAKRPLHRLYSKRFSPASPVLRPYPALQDRHLEFVDMLFATPASSSGIFCAAAHPESRARAQLSVPCPCLVQPTTGGQWMENSLLALPMPSCFTLSPGKAHSILGNNTSATPSTCMRTLIRTTAGGEVSASRLTHHLIS